MKIHEVENMNAAGMKQNREAIIESLSGESPADLIARYYQARLDAKIRDEKLAEQAEILEALQIGLNAAKRQSEVDAAALSLAAETVESVQRDLNKTIGDAARKHEQDMETLLVLRQSTNADAEEFMRQNSDLTARCERLKLQAKTYDSAITTIHKAAADAIASRELARADQGE